jgi:predicted transcriptional regulator
MNHFPKTEIVLMSPPKIKLEALGSDNSFNSHSLEILEELNMKEKAYCADNDVHFMSLYDVLEGNIHD